MPNISSNHFEIEPYGTYQISPYPKMLASASGVTKLFIQTNCTLAFEKTDDNGNTILRGNTQTQVYVIRLCMAFYLGR